jgi:hypothetical protein
LDAASVDPITAALTALPEDLGASLLRALVGMFSDSSVAATVRSNIQLIAGAAWAVAPEDARQEAGFKYAQLQANGEVTRAAFARSFLELVGGLPYLPGDALALEINTALENLSTAHGGWDNFYNEVPHATILRSLIPATGLIPVAVRLKYVRTLTLCRVGNGYGVSRAAQPIYDDLIARWGDRDVATFVVFATSLVFSSRLGIRGCAANYSRIAGQLMNRTTAPLLRRALEYIRDFPTARMGEIREDVTFRQIILDMRTAKLA